MRPPPQQPLLRLPRLLLASVRAECRQRGRHADSMHRCSRCCMVAALLSIVATMSVGTAGRTVEWAARMLLPGASRKDVCGERELNRRNSAVEGRESQGSISHCHTATERS